MIFNQQPGGFVGLKRTIGVGLGEGKIYGVDFNELGDL